MKDREVITCAWGTLKDRHGQHMHDDRCFEVRTAYPSSTSCELPYWVSDLFGSPRVLQSSQIQDAPEILKQRKIMFLRRMVKVLRNSESVEHNRHAGAAFLTKLLQEVDDYVFVSPSIVLRTADPTQRTEQTIDQRACFDQLARRLLDFRAASRKGLVEPPDLLISHIERTLRGLTLDTPA